MSARRLSVVINTFNRANSLPATLDGLDRQTGGSFEVIVVSVRARVSSSRSPAGRSPISRMNSSSHESK